MTALTRRLDMASKHADRIMGKRALYYANPVWTLNVETGEQSLTTSPVSVRVRPWPMSVRERTEYAQAGLSQVDTRWTMRVAYQGVSLPGDMLKVGTFFYEIIDGGVSTDEHHVDHTILTRRRR